MSVVAEPRPASDRPNRPGPGSRRGMGDPIIGWTRLVRLHLRSSRWWLLAWLVIPPGVVVATGHSIAALYRDTVTRLGYASTMDAAPGSVAINGRWRDLDTIGGIVTNEVGVLGLLIFPLAGVLLAVRLTRSEEDAGRLDLLSAGRLGRLAPLVAATAVSVGVAVVMAIIMAIGLRLADLPTGGAALYAALMALSTILWAGVGLLAAQVARDSRTATTIALGALLVGYLVRMVVDGWGSAAEWLSPVGWLPVAAPFGAWRWEPYAATIASTLVLLVAAAVAAARRDLDGGLIAPRPGPQRGARRLGSPIGLTLRLAGPSMVGWVIGLSAWSGVLGLLADEMTGMLANNPLLLQMFGLDRPEDAVVSMTASMTALGLAAMGVQSIGRPGVEESSGRLGLVLSGAVTARRLWAAWTAVVIVVVALTAAAQAGLFAAASMVSTGRSAGAAAVLDASPILLIPAVVVIVLAAALRAAAPGWTAIPWLLIAWGAVVAFLAEALRLPDWARDLSVFHVVGRVPVDDPHLAAIVALTVIGAMCVVVGWVVVGRRDLTA